MEIVFFAIVAGLVLARLYQVLGQKTGAPPPVVKDPSLKEGGFPQNPKVIDGLPINAEPMEFGDAMAEFGKIQVLEKKYGDLFSKISQMRQIMPDFDPIVFETNVTLAYEAIISAYSRGDEAALKPLVNDEVFAAYSAQMQSSGKSENTLSEIVKLSDPEIRDIEINEKSAQIDVYFSATLKDVNSTPRNTQEIWTFERIIGSNSPIWRLIAVETA